MSTSAEPMTAQPNGAIHQAGEEPILLRADNSGVTTLTLNRPKQFNACALTGDVDGATRGV